MNKLIAVVFFNAWILALLDYHRTSTDETLRHAIAAASSFLLFAAIMFWG